MSAPPAARGPWTLELVMLPGAACELSVVRCGVPVSHGDVVELWCRDEAFRSFFDQALAGVATQSASEAVFWETPPVTRSTLGQAFRCIVVDAPALARLAPEPRVFDAELADAGPAGVACFPNLGRDAQLVVPAARQGVPAAAYAHLAAFLRGAPADHRDALWAAVGRAVAERVGPRPLWVSTSGLGVAWLHVRLDSVPKYYVHAPYRSAPT